MHGHHDPELNATEFLFGESRKLPSMVMANGPTIQAAAHEDLQKAWGDDM